MRAASSTCLPSSGGRFRPYPLPIGITHNPARRNQIHPIGRVPMSRRTRLFPAKIRLLPAGRAGRSELPRLLLIGVGEGAAEGAAHVLGDVGGDLLVMLLVDLPILGLARAGENVLQQRLLL